MPEPGLKLALVSLGCPKNRVDSEVMLAQAAAAGYVVAADPADADVIVVNTCAFIGPAQKESVDSILSLARYKAQGSCRALVVSGCLAERFAHDLLAEMPEVDAVVGTGRYREITTVIDDVLHGRRQAYLGRYQPGTDGLVPLPRLVTTPGHYAYLKVAEGCDHRCSFCVIPSLRGPNTSRPLPELITEARQLAGMGVRELIVVAQDTTSYGLDLYGRRALPELLRALAGIEELAWIRVLYLYPQGVDDALVEVMASHARICPYLDLPLQHSYPAVLRAMRRPADTDSTLARLQAMRAAVPGLAVRTSLIVGFPGETEEAFLHLTGFVEQARFDHLGVFTYSREESTEAAALPGQLPEKVKNERQRKLMLLQHRISTEILQGFVGNEIEVMLDRNIGPGRWLGHTRRQAPDLDGAVYLKGVDDGRPGEIRRARVNRVTAYDLYATAL